MESTPRADAARTPESGSVWLAVRDVADLAARGGGTVDYSWDDGLKDLVFNRQAIAVVAEWAADPKVVAAGYAEPLRQLHDFLAHRGKVRLP